MSILSRTADAVGEALGINIRSSTRLAQYVEARAIYYNICRNRYNFTLIQIADEVYRDTASVVHGLKSYKNWTATDARFRNKSRIVEAYVIGAEILSNKEHISCDELLSENKKLKIEINELTLRAESLEREFDSMRRIAPMVDRLQQKIPQGKELEAEKQLNRFLNGLRL